jgi:hypothetical protein
MATIASASEIRSFRVEVSGESQGAQLAAMQKLARLAGARRRRPGAGRL